MNQQNNYCTFYLVRHGESEGNAKGVIQGTSDFPLTEKGKNQVRGLNEKLVSIKFDAIFSSDLLRAKETAEILNLERQLVVQISKLIRERNYGVYEGRKGDDFNNDVKKATKQLEEMTDKMNRSIWDFGDLSTVEKREELVARMITFIREIAITHANKTVLVVAHGGLFRNFLIHIGFANKKELVRGSVSNASYIKLKSDGINFFVEETYGIKKETQ